MAKICTTLFSFARPFDDPNLGSIRIFGHHINNTMNGRSGWRWALGLFYIVAVAAIWIAASYIVQSVVDTGVSPFLITYICNSLFIVYIPIVEIARYWDDSVKSVWIGHNNASNDPGEHCLEDSDKVVLLDKNDSASDIIRDDSTSSTSRELNAPRTDNALKEVELPKLHPGGNLLAEPQFSVVGGETNNGVDSKGRWTRSRMAKVSLLISPFWFLAQLSFNLSLKFTTVTSNTILSTSSSLFTFFFALVFLNESFTWIKLASVLLCMVGTVTVSIGDSRTGVDPIASNPLLGDALAIVSALFYGIYVTLIRVKLPDEGKGEGQASMAQFLGFLGLFNLLIFFPIAFILNFTELEPFYMLGWKQFGFIVGKGLLDNVLSDYLWAKAVLLTTTTVASAGLAIQVPLAALVDSIMGHAPHLMDYFGAVAIMVGFVGISVPSNFCIGSDGTDSV